MKKLFLWLLGSRYWALSLFGIDDGIAALGGGLIAGVGSILGSSQNAKAVQEANDKQIALARDQMAFQERMSSTAYTRAAADMENAGINPRVAFVQGSGAAASTPSGSVPNLRAPEPGEGIRGALAGAKDVISVDRELRQADSNIQLNNAAAAAKASEVALNVANAKQADAGALYVTQQSKKSAIDTKTSEMRFPTAKAEASTAKAQAEWDKWALPYDNVIKRIGDVLQFANPLRLLRGGPGPTKGAPPSPAEKNAYRQGLEYGRSGR